MRAPTALSALLLALLASAALAAPASASFEPIELQSVGPLDQFEEAQEPAIAAGGGYLAFRGALDGVKGVFRKSLQTGQLQIVARGDASAPSISADGRYVSFTTTAQLVAAAKPGGNVFVRDMDRPAPASEDGACTPEEEAGQGGQACPYELVSALNGSGEGLTYSSSAAGSIATGRAALSANGRKVAFVVEGESNLTSSPGDPATGEPPGSTPGKSTPGPQVAVRYLDSRETVLVSAERDSESGRMTDLPVQGGAVTATGGAPGATLSADGTTVAWLGAEITRQVSTLSDEAAQIANDDAQPAHHYDEPLWRRIADGSGAPTRRIVGGGDPLAPGCPPGGTLAMAACQGPFPHLATTSYDDRESHLGWRVINGGAYDDVPQLSADGRTVALVGDPDGSSNVFVANMGEGLDRVQALRQLTAEIPVFETVNPGTDQRYVPGAGDVYDLAISPDGTRIAFTTQREQFPLAPPFFNEPALAQLGVDELYEIDLRSQALERVTHGPADGPSLEGETTASVTERGASSPSFTEHGGKLAFADSASNLVFGDVNQAPDVFTVSERSSSPAQQGTSAIGAPPPQAQPTVQWRMSVVALAHPDGTATLDVVVPGAGRLTATATAAVPVETGVARRARGGKHASRRRRRTSVSELRNRTVASAQMPTASAGLLEVPLRVGAPYAGAVESATGIYALVRVTFAGAGGPELTQTLAITLRRVVPKRRAVARHGTRRRARRTSRPRGRSR